MEVPIAVVILFYGAVIEAKDFLKTGRNGDVISIPGNSQENDSSDVLALLILEHNTGPDSEESDQSLSFSKPKKLPITSVAPKHIPTDSSGDSNSDEYQDTDGETNTDSESNYYHEDDYKKYLIDKIRLSDIIDDESSILRKQWRSCQKKAASVCREACKASYKNACDMAECRSKLKKYMKRECKRNCKDLFM